ncbi:sigma-70 family RNA polymerase sigma factor [Achromobacter pestifer]|uniref:Putative RNA polymerase sigma factor FecI n=1 Tax=Achromobacter pestifer TaxID=1353889 RepID=A0A6S6YKI5_9BURK|nr:sigma-70 family RNA polymerase sigma factor [Achromobacter pestifer]CAB3628439.1 putative RNA polymerase sigma factor FecI [Achromobacter pestifer]
MRCAADPAATQRLHTLYRNHHGWLYNWLRGRLGNAADAADLAQDAFVRLLTRPRDFDGFDGERAYLSTMARGLCVDLWRRREIEQAWLATQAARPEPFQPSPEHHAIIIETLCEIDALLGRLPWRTAEAFLMAMAYGMSDAEIAAELQVSDRMVRKYVAQAMLHCISLQALTAQALAAQS